jgi:hypothetical protein
MISKDGCKVAFRGRSSSSPVLKPPKMNIPKTPIGLSPVANDAVGNRSGLVQNWSSLTTC